MVRIGSAWLNTGLVAVEFHDVCRVKSKKFLTNLYGVRLGLYLLIPKY